ncbi:MAG: hypothetical protein FJ147_00685 [Deltaproteobacteria bacterium]|nr:hypothetical protein [Deltaproteobacteria bacterium]
MATKPMVISRKYEVVGQLGQGGMGLVYKVRHTALDTISALKVLPAYLMENEDMVNRFYREARVMARLNHPNIVRVLDIERDETLNLYYFVMEYIEGVTLGKYIREKGPLPLPEILRISRQVAEALGYAHGHTPPIIHRDIKPANIMIEDHSSRVVVMDFGIAKELGDGDSTKTGMVIGTLKYASPEQLRHEQLDGGADVYSLGMVMYEMCTGRQFFGGLDEHAVLGKVLYDTKENEPHFDRPTPAAFADLLTRAIAKNRAHRYHSMRELLQALESCRNLSADGEDTGTLILSGLGKKEEKKQEAQADDDIEDQIRKLEEERERRRILSLQTQAREARERATRDGASEWAATLLQQGMTAEGHGAKSLRDKDFTAAQQAFDEAIQIFTQAAAEAQTAAAKRKAEQARGNMAAAKEEAEHYGARGHARTRYARALTLESQADEFLEKGDFQHAAHGYSEAARSFADAREQAYRETLKDEAEKAHARATAAKAAAEEQGATRLAANLFREAADQEQRASAAITHEEFTQARELYLAAAQKYERAQQEAVNEQQRLETVAVQQQAKEAQRQAEDAQARDLASPLYQQATLFQKQGDTQLQAKAYDKAKQAYLQARDRYEQATQEAATEQDRQATAAVRQQLQQAQVQADQAEAKERAASSYQQIQRLVAEGQEHEKREQYRESRHRYTEAAQRFQQLARECAVLAAREQADTARQKMAEVVQGSEPLQAWAKENWAQARERVQRADQAYQKQEYRSATDLYTQAAKAYTQARTNAEQEQLQQEVRDAQQQAQSAKTRAEQREATRYAAELWRDGLAALSDAEKQIRTKELRAAIQRYWRAAELLAKAADDAQRERHRQEAVSARQRTTEARQIAEKSGAAQRFATDFAKASHLVEQAAQAETQENFSQASEAYQQARQLWERLGGEAFRQAEKEKAEAARKRAAESRNGLAGLTEWRGAKWADAERTEAEANAAWEAQQYAKAAEAYDRVTQRYIEARTEAEKARHAAEIERQRRRALDAQQQAEEARAEAQRAEAERYATALFQQGAQTAQQAEQQMHAQHWNDASQAFAQARSLWSQAAHDAQQERARQAVIALRQRLEAAQVAATEAAVHSRFAQEFARAQQVVVRGQQAETQQDFSQASDLYEQARQQLLRLRRDADVEAAREDAAAARQQMLQAKENASELKQWANAQWEAAQKQEADAERAFSDQDYENALAQYTQTAQLYTTAATAGEQERLRQETAAAEKQAGTAKKQAEEVDAPRYAATDFNQAAAALDEASRHQRQQKFSQATREYRHAEELFVQAKGTAQHEYAKQEMLAALQRAEEAGSAATQSSAEQRFPREFAQVRGLFERGQAAQKKDDFTTARQNYEQAQQQFIKLVQAVQQQIAQEEADVVRQQAAQAKQAASTLAPRFAAARWKEAQTSETEGEKAWQAQAYEQARAHYAQAAQIYEYAQAEAEVEEQQQRALLANQEAKGRQREADAVHAPQYAADLYRQAQEVREQAEAALAAKQFEESVTLSAQAGELFGQALGIARLARAKQAATESQKRAVAAQAEAQAVRSEEFLPGQHVEAMSELHKAEQALADEKFDAARDQFDRNVSRWKQIRQESEVAWQKHEAEGARTRAYELRQQTQTAKGKQKKSAEKFITTGDQSFQQKRYPQALASYNEASALLSALQQQETEVHPLLDQGPTTEGERTSRPVPVDAPSPARQSSPVVAGIAAFVVVAALGFYFSRGGESVNPQKPSTQQAQEEEARKAAQANAAQEEEARLKAEQAKADQLKAEEERRKAEEVAKSQKAEDDRRKAEEVAKAQKAEEDRRKAEAAKAEADRVKAEQAKAEKLKADQEKAAKAEADRLKAEQEKTLRAEAERLKAEQEKAAKAEADRVKAEQAKAEKLKADQEKAAKAEADRLKAEQEKAAKAEAERLRAEQEKTARAEEERRRAEEAVRQRAAEEERRKAEAARLAEEERLAKVQREETERAKEAGPPSDREAMNWLETIYRPAWENKNTDALVQLGEISAQDATRLRGILEGYKSYSVSFRDVSVRNEGNRAVVRFIRVDTIDGKTLALPPKEVKLEKSNGGRVARTR